jgi:FkbM family methyltransferase
MSKLSPLWILDGVRDRYHPVHALRRIALLRRLVRVCDVQVWAQIHGVTHPVRLYALRNGSYLLGRRAPEPSIAALMLAILDTCAIKSFWDIDANIGYYSWLIHSARPGVRVLAVEPDATNFALLERTRNHAPGVEILKAAISRADGAATFLVDTVSGATGTLETDLGTFNERHYGEARHATTVPTRSLDSLACGRVLPDLIKIDVEGHEAAVVEGAALVLRASPIVLIEAWDAATPALQTLRAAGYHLLDAASLSQNTPTDGNYLAVPGARHSMLDTLRRAHRDRAAAMGLRTD